MARIVEQNTENRTQLGSARSQETPPGVDRTAPPASAEHDAPIADDTPDIVDVVLE
ncbi:MAG: integrase, partial [Rhizobiaceae bacterium]